MIDNLNGTREADDWSCKLDSKGGLEYSITYLIPCTDRLDGPGAAARAVGYRIGSVYAVGNEGDWGAVCKSITAKRDGKAKQFRVTVTWSQRDPQEEQPNPLDRPVRWTYSHENFQRVAWKDREGKGILNSAREYFDPPPEIDDSRPRITAERNEASFDPALTEKYQDAINADEWLGFKKNCVKCNGISAQGPNWENGVKFWIVSYEFAIRWDTWTLSLLDQGRNEFYAGPGARVPIQNRDSAGNQTGDAVADPVPLDGEGLELANPTPDNVEFLDFDVYRERSFAELQLT